MSRFSIEFILGSCANIATSFSGVKNNELIIVCIITIYIAQGFQISLSIIGAVGVGVLYVRD